MIFDSEDKKHLKKMNLEFGEMCVRIGKLEGQIEQGFGSLSANMKWIERKFGDLQCNEHANTMLKLETKLATMEGREWVWNKGRYVLATFITGAITALIVTHLREIMGILGL